MKRNYLLLILNVLLLCGLFSCKKEDNKMTESKPVVMLPNIINQDRTLSSDTIYAFDQSVTVRENAVLTIKPGTVIKGLPTGQGDKFIAIARGSKIMAEGTADQPIIFTSGRPAGERLHGDWQGLYIFGNAPVSVFDDNIFGPGTEMALLESMGAGAPKGGGDDPADNSGILKYVRIEFAGNNNVGDGYGLACVGVGTGTTIENVQVSYTEVSGFGFFGGTVNARHLVAFNNRVAGFIYSNGYTGKQQFVLSYKHPYFGSSGAAFIYTCDALLITNDIKDYPSYSNTRPVLSNVTVIGPYDNPGYDPALPWNAALNVRGGGAFALRNSVFMGMPKAGIIFSENTAAENLVNNVSEFVANQVHSNVQADAFSVSFNVYSVDGAAINEYALNHNNKSYAKPQEMQLADPFNFRTPGVLPQVGSPVLSGASFNGSDYNTYFQQVGYVGAFGTDDWMKGWTNFYPVTTVY